MRRHRLAVRPQGFVAQVKRVRPPVLGNVPLLGNARLGLVVVRPLPRESFENRMGDAALRLA
jgi:hypothetical protein